jgi:hypothetical protein
MDTPQTPPLTVSQLRELRAQAQITAHYERTWHRRRRANQAVDMYDRLIAAKRLRLTPDTAPV